MRAVIATVLALAVAGQSSGVLAQSTRTEPSRAPLSAGELDDHRGGFVTAGGITLGFGAVVRTYVDGRLALESRLTWTERGAVTERRLGDHPGVVDLQSALDTALAQGLDLRGVADGQGVLLSDADGATALIQSLNGGVRNLIVNNADGRDLRQEVELTLTLPDLTVMQRDFSVERLGSQLNADIQAGLLPSLGR